MGKVFATQMEEQVAASQVPDQEFKVPQMQMPMPGSIPPEIVEQMKARAREEAIRMTLEQRNQGIGLHQMPGLPIRPEPQVIYVRRNLTVAEILVMLLIACGLVTGVQLGWKVISNVLPSIEIKVK